MTFDQLKDKWQSHQPDRRLNIEAGILLKEVQRNKQTFEAVIFWRDFREVAVAFLLVIAFTYFGLKSGSWATILMAIMCLLVGVFFVVDRILQRKKRPQFADSLTGCITDSITQVAHQIWLLKNVFWWYLLPFLIGAALMTGEMGWTMRDNTAQLWRHILQSTAIWVLLVWGVYKLNQYAVRKELIPRKDELHQLLDTVTNSAERKESPDEI